MTKPPAAEDAWAALLRGLTPDWPDDAPWCLVSPPHQPAFMQPPVPGGDLAAFKSRAATPDGLDMLVTSKNHDLKSEVMAEAQPEDWLFALVSLQTMAGYGGKTLYGISRMNSGSGSRPALGVALSLRPSARFVRDLSILLRNRDKVLAQNDLKPKGGIDLVWLEPWDGKTQIAFRNLDPFYIEICRRLRLGGTGARLYAARVGSTSERIAAELKGRTGDPWTPIEVQNDKVKACEEPKAFTITKDGFSYRKMAELLLQERYIPALLQKIDDGDADEGLTVVACGIARDDKKTDGYYERSVPMTKTVVRLFQAHATDPLAGWAAEYVKDAGQVHKLMRRALFALLQHGPPLDKVNNDSHQSKKCAAPFLSRFDKAVDARFFDHLWQEAEVADGGEDARLAVRFQWHRWLAAQAHGLLVEAADAVPHASMRRYRARVRAEALFYGTLHKHFPHLQPKERKGDVA